MTSSPDGAQPGRRVQREPVLLRGAPAAQAAPYREAAAPAPRPQPELPAQRDPLRGDDGGAYTGPERRRGSVRRAADMPVPGAAPRLGDVYAEELARLREHARAEGYAAGFAEGGVAAQAVVAQAEAEARARLADVQARWERRLVSAAAALGDAVRRLEQAALPVAEEVRDSVLGAAVTLVEDILGRELALAEDPGLDALRRALTLCPEDAPVVVRLHPDDLAEVPAEALAALPAAVTVVGDPRVERAGAVAESGSRRIDAQIGPALERVQAVLSS
jgi:flagellar assembly protein FliH